MNNYELSSSPVNSITNTFVGLTFVQSSILNHIRIGRYFTNLALLECKCCYNIIQKHEQKYPHIHNPALCFDMSTEMYLGSDPVESYDVISSIFNNEYITNGQRSNCEVASYQL